MEKEAKRYMANGNPESGLLRKKPASRPLSKLFPGSFSSATDRHGEPGVANPGAYSLFSMENAALVHSRRLSPILCQLRPISRRHFQSAPFTWPKALQLAENRLCGGGRYGASIDAHPSLGIRCSVQGSM